MSEQQPIPAETLRAVIKAISDRRAIIGAGMMTSDEFARLALEAAGVPSLVAELAELRASSDLRWCADQRARERWKAAHPGQPLTWPDHTDLCVWLMAELETALTAAERGKGDSMNNKPNCETPIITTCPPPLPKTAMPLGSLRITPDRDAITENEPHGGEGDE